MTRRRDLAAEAVQLRARAARRTDRQAAVARRVLTVINAGPDWLYNAVPLGAHAALLRPVQAQEDREARAIWDESSRRAREAEAARRRANGSGCPYCPCKTYEVIEHLPDDLYGECTECFALWFIAPKPDDPDGMLSSHTA